MAPGDIWIKLDVEYFSDPRINAAGERAEILHLRALCFSSRILSDGFIADGHLPFFSLTTVQRRANKLVETGLWERVPGGYRIKEYENHGRTRAEVQQIRANNNRRKRAQRLREKLELDDFQTPQTVDEQRQLGLGHNGVTRDVTGMSHVTSRIGHADVTQPDTEQMKTSSSSARARAGAYARDDDDDDEPADAETPPPTPPTDPADGFPLQPADDTPLTDLAWLWHCDRHPEATLAFPTRDDYVLAVLDLATDRFPPGRARAEWQGRILTEYLAELLGMHLTDTHRRRITALAATHDHALVLDGLSLAATRASGGADQTIGYADRCIREQRV